jgi:hypothetical protein
MANGCWNASLQSLHRLDDWGFVSRAANWGHVQGNPDSSTNLLKNSYIYYLFDVPSVRIGSGQRESRSRPKNDHLVPVDPGVDICHFQDRIFVFKVFVASYARHRMDREAARCDRFVKRDSAFSINQGPVV